MRRGARGRRGSQNGRLSSGINRGGDENWRIAVILAGAARDCNVSPRAATPLATLRAPFRGEVAAQAVDAAARWGRGGTDVEPAEWRGIRVQADRRAGEQLPEVGHASGHVAA